MSLFSRRRDQPEDPQAVVDRLAASSGTAAVPAGAGPTIPGGAAGFLMTVEDVFVITGRGVVVTGKVAAGQVSRGAAIEVYRAGVPVGTLTVTGVEMFRKQVDTASTGENVGLLVSAKDRTAVQRGDELVTR
jgi:translation elongation factor EF-Tu-like GTPase